MSDEVDPLDQIPTVGGNDVSADASVPLRVRNARSCRELEAEILAAAATLHSSRYELIRTLTAFDDAGAWASSGAITSAHWASSRLGVSVGTAHEWLRIGHILVKLPALNAAFADRRLSYSAIRTLSRVAIDHPEHQQELVALAEATRPADLAHVLARWAMGHDSDNQRDIRDRDQTYLSTRIDLDGMGVVHMRVPVVELGRIRAAVDARVMQSHRSDPNRRHPSLGFQRAMALVELLTGRTAQNGPEPRPSDGHTPVTCKVETEVIVHVRSNGVSLHDGTPLADSVLRGLIDTAFIRVLIHNSQNRPINASNRRRYPTVRQRRVVDERHPRCVDCGGTELLEYDHEPPFSVTGHTHTDELTRRCSQCHDRRHRDGGP